ncbi:MAG: hypothetical protein FJ294_07580 [Planctomycetes bacterium]|nr:hypothetical protein [Planctomycetota bacterium]
MSAKSLVACALLVAGTLWAFAPALEAGLVNWDDATLLLGNPHFRALGADNMAWCFATNHAGPYQPLTWLSYALDHALWPLGESLDAAQAYGFHRTNVLLHALNACAVFALARRLLGGHAVAFVAALVFALHPLRVESVAWVTERRDVLYTGLLLASVLAWLRWRETRGEAPRPRAPVLVAAIGACVAPVALLASTRGPAGEWLQFEFDPWGVLAASLALGACVVASLRAFPGSRGRWLALSVVLFVLSLLAKASGMTLAFALVGLDQLLGRRSWVDKLPYLAAGVMAGALAYMGQAAQPQAIASWSEHTPVERVLQACYGLVFYVRASLWPSKLVPIHEIPSEISLVEPRFALAAALVVLACCLTVALRKRFPRAVLAVALYALLVGPMLGLAQCGPQLVADRYSYVPAIPLALLGAAGLFRMLEPRNALFCGSLAGLGLGLLAREQCHVWRDSEALWSWTVSVAPRSAIAQTALAETHKERAFATQDASARRELFERASASYELALELETSPRTACNAAVVQLELAQLDAASADARRARALELARLALVASERANSSTSQPRLVAGLALYHMGRAGEAVTELQLHLDLEAESAVGWSHLGLALAELGRTRDAASAFARAVALRPDDIALRWQWARALERSGEADAAREAAREVLRRAPGHAGATDALQRLGSR